MNQWLFPICNFAFKRTLDVFSDFNVEGKENIPTVGPVLIVSNHMSNIDPAIVAAVITRKPMFLAKKEIFQNKLFDFLLRSYGAYPVDRGRADIRALNWAEKQLNLGRTIIMFPEGTRSKTGGLLDGKLGVAKLAADTGATIVPIGIAGSESLQNVLKVLAPVSKLRIKIGNSFKINKDRCIAREAYKSATKEIMLKIALQLPDSYRGHYKNAENFPFDYITDIK